MRGALAGETGAPRHISSPFRRCVTEPHGRSRRAAKTNDARTAACSVISIRDVQPCTLSPKAHAQDIVVTPAQSRLFLAFRDFRANSLKLWTLHATVGADRAFDPIALDQARFPHLHASEARVFSVTRHLSFGRLDPACAILLISGTRFRFLDSRHILPKSTLWPVCCSRPPADRHGIAAGFRSQRVLPNASRCHHRDGSGFESRQ